MQNVASILFAIPKTLHKGHRELDLNTLIVYLVQKVFLPVTHYNPTSGINSAVHRKALWSKQ